MLPHTEPCPVMTPELSKLPPLWAPLRALLDAADSATGWVVHWLDMRSIELVLVVAAVLYLIPKLLAAGRSPKPKWLTRVRRNQLIRWNINRSIRFRRKLETLLHRKHRRRIIRYQLLPDYVETWLPIVLFFSFGIILIHQDFGREWFLTQARPMSQTCLFTFYYPMTVFMIISLGVITWVCLIWSLVDLDHLHVHHTELGTTLKRSARFLCFVCILFAGVLICHLSNVSEPRYSSDPLIAAQAWDELAELNEGVSTVIFVLFTVIDLCVYKAADYAVDGELRELHELAKSHNLDGFTKTSTLDDFAHSKELEASVRSRDIAKFIKTKDLGELAWETIWIVDVPCVIGVSFVMCVHRSLHDWMFQNALFAIGLSAGAIAIHVAITQSAFAVLKTRKMLDGIQSEIGDQSHA